MFNHAAQSFCNQLNLKLPIIQAPMAGGIVSPALVAKVAKHGGLGTLPLGYLSLAESQKAIQEVKKLTSNRFSVNIFIPAVIDNPSSMQINKMIEYINTYRIQAGLAAYTELPFWIEPDINELIDVIIHEGISILSFTFGIPGADLMKRLRKENLFIMGTATTVDEGLALETAGCHAVIAQGGEAGGHRGGGFLDEYSDGVVGTIALVPQMVDAVTIPVIASGGIMDGRGIAAALTLGASAVQMGTAFLTCDESQASSMHKKMILESRENDTCITRAFTGKPVRALNNEFITKTEQKFSNNELLPYPLQHLITKELRRNANNFGHSEYAGLWGGQGSRLSRSMPVEALMKTLEKETLAVLAQFKK